MDHYIKDILGQPVPVPAEYLFGIFVIIYISAKKRSKRSLSGKICLFVITILIVMALSYLFTTPIINLVSLQFS